MSFYLPLIESVRSMPAAESIRAPTLENHDWVGRARVLIATWDDSKDKSFGEYSDSLFVRSNEGFRDRNTASSSLAKMMNMIQEARNELRLMTGGRISGAFDAGQPFEIYDELRMVIETAQREVLFVDRWMGADFVTKFMPHVRQKLILISFNSSVPGPFPPARVDLVTSAIPLTSHSSPMRTSL